MSHKFETGQFVLDTVQYAAREVTTVCLVQVVKKYLYPDYWVRTFCKQFWVLAEKDLCNLHLSAVTCSVCKESFEYVEAKIQEQYES